MKRSELLTVADTVVLTEAAGKAVNDSTSTATYCLQGGVWLLCHMKYGICTVWVTKKFPFFETRYRATVILRSVFVSVPFYNFPCFYCCVSILKVRRKERLKNGVKNGAKTATQRVFSTALFF